MCGKQVEIESLCSFWSSWLSHVLCLFSHYSIQVIFLKLNFITLFLTSFTFPSLHIQSISNEHTQWTSCKLFLLPQLLPTQQTNYVPLKISSKFQRFVFAHPGPPDSIALSQGLDPTILFKLQLNATSTKDLLLYPIPGHLFSSSLQYIMLLFLVIFPRTMRSCQ